MIDFKKLEQTLFQGHCKICCILHGFCNDIGYKDRRGRRPVGQVAEEQYTKGTKIMINESYV